jgi:hypothetical protein
MLDDSEIIGVLQARKAAAESYEQQEVVGKRDLAHDYFEGKLFGNEISGRSHAILTDVRDKVEALMPALMKVFTSGTRVVKFLPVEPEDEQYVEEATDVVNHVFQSRNNGFHVLYTGFKDALLDAVGITKVWNEEKTVTKKETLYGLSVDELDDLEDDPEMEVISVEARLEADDLGNEVTLFDAETSTTRTETREMVGNVHPTNFHIDPLATRVQDACYVAEDILTTPSDLKKQGFEDVDDLPAFTFVDKRDDTRPRSDTGALDKPSRTVQITEHYVEIDIDEDGMSERYKITTAGDNTRILEKVEWDGDWPYQAGTPTIKPHEFYGISLAEEVADLQMIKSTILRIWLDNLYGANVGRVKVYETQPGQVNLDDVLNKRVDGVIRIRSAPGGQADVVPMENQFIGDTINAMMEKLDQIGEVRTGVTNFGQGLDPNVLHKTPATTAGFMMTLAQEKQALIARVFAETWVKDIFLALYGLIRKNGGKRSFRMNGKFMDVDPSKWPEQTECMVNVGLGTGNKIQQAQNVNTLIQLQNSGLGLVSPQNKWNAISQAVDAYGFPHAELYFTNPLTPEGQQLAQQQAQEAQQAQVDQVGMARVQLEAQKAQAKTMVDQARLQMDMAKMQEELGLEKYEVIQNLKLKAQELMQNAQLKLLEIQTEAQLEGMELGVETDLKRRELALQARLESRKINIDTNVRDPDNT